MPVWTHPQASRRFGSQGWTVADRWYRPVMLGLTIVLLGYAGVQAWRLYETFAANDAVGIDYRTWVVIGERVLAGGGFYLPEQLVGPYRANTTWLRHPPEVPTLYPPPFVLVCIALTVAPAVLWWAIPLGLLTAAFARWRPAPWAWPLLALAACWPSTASVVIVGGTSMWIAALLAAGLRWHWPTVFIVVKPTLAPLALIGIGHRSWWIAAAGLAVVSIALLPMWFDYLTAMLNVSDARLAYSFGDLPMFAAVGLAWFARTTDRPDREMP